MFAGYVFSRFEVSNRLRILKVPGVVHIVGFGNSPQPIDPREMASVFTLMDTRLPVMPHPYLKIGERVRLSQGPLRGAEGVVLEQKSETKLVLSITVLQRSVAVDVDPAWIDGSLW
jgi:transcription antitermination factor NusG